MAKQLTVDEMVTLAAKRWALFGDDVVAAAIATAWVESNWVPSKENWCCVGLWAVNARAHGLNRRDLKNPETNADEAFQIWQAAGHTFTPDWRVNWDAKARRKYDRVLPIARQAVKARKDKFGKGVNLIGAAKNLAETSAGVARDVVDEPFDWVDDFADRLFPVLINVAVVGTGLALIGYAVKSLFSSPQAGEHAQKAAPVAAGAAGGAS